MYSLKVILSWTSIRIIPSIDLELTCYPIILVRTVQKIQPETISEVRKLPRKILEKSLRHHPTFSFMDDVNHFIEYLATTDETSLKQISPTSNQAAQQHYCFNQTILGIIERLIKNLISKTATYNPLTNCPPSKHSKVSTKLQTDTFDD